MLHPNKSPCETDISDNILILQLAQEIWVAWVELAQLSNLPTSFSHYRCDLSNVNSLLSLYAMQQSDLPLQQCAAAAQVPCQNPSFFSRL